MRGREVWLVVLAAVVGCIAGLSVVAINCIVDTMHLLLFDLDAGSRLSSVEALPSDISFLSRFSAGSSLLQSRIR